MIIVSKEKNDAYNLDKAERIYIGHDNPVIKIVSGSTRAGNLGEYETFKKARKALEMALKDIELGRKLVTFMPDDDTVDAALNNKDCYHHVTGKKTKGHGGS